MSTHNSSSDTVSMSPSTINANTPTAQGSTSSTPQPQSKHNNKAKRNRFTGPRHGGASYQKKTLPLTLGIAARKSFFPVHFTPEGATTLGANVYRWLAARDFRLTQNVPMFLLQYATHMLVIARTMYVSQTLGYYFHDNASRFIKICKSIKLPDLLAQYVESLGSVETPNGHCIVPITQSWQECQDLNYMVGHLPLLAQLGHQGDIPDWGFVPDILADYNNGISRAERLGQGFRVVDFDSPNGKREFLVSYRPTADGLLPCAPLSILAVEAELGCIFRWRNADDRDQWLGRDNHLILPDFEGHTMEERTFTSGLMGERHRPEKSSY